MPESETEPVPVEPAPVQVPPAVAEPVAFTLVPTPELVAAVIEETLPSQPPAPAPQPPVAAPLVPRPQMSDEELAQLLGRLDETLGMIRGRRSQAS
jgi:hypothetical protein